MITTGFKSYKDLNEIDYAHDGERRIAKDTIGLINKDHVQKVAYAKEAYAKETKVDSKTTVICIGIFFGLFAGLAAHLLGAF